ncbi:hypothetical protein D4Z93_04835 [Clostridium fermenticellae]|uniref:SPOR domain-containing protein n=1 Tax=Clostridium fermenticellae TaxID=2068654 RepID=A0A386H2E6_9CLOT|nr:hypothetical protein [Clostridium fermenticellae]AYD39877.1 hypothetical protein D4Z93_04835 [Clostridium fermenticellae]
MKYTRYDLGQRGGGKTFVLTVVLILVFAFLFATIIFKIFVSGGNYRSKAENTVSKQTDNKSGSGTKNNTAVEDNQKIGKFVAVQGGIYKDKNNAEQEKNVLKKYGTPFSVTEQDKTRILLGIYNEETGKNVAESLNQQKVDNSKMTFSIYKDNTCDIQISEIVNAYIQVLNKASDKNVEAVETADLKKWSNSLQSVRSGKNLDKLKQIKTYINKLPDRISKDNVESEYTYIYGFLSKVGKK